MGGFVLDKSWFSSKRELSVFYRKQALVEGYIRLNNGNLGERITSIIMILISVCTGLSYIYYNFLNIFYL